MQGLVPDVGLSPTCREAEAHFVVVGRWLNNLFKISIGQVFVFEIILRRNTICSEPGTVYFNRLDTLRDSWRGKTIIVAAEVGAHEVVEAR